MTIPKVNIRYIQGLQLMAAARQHAIILDQPAESGGTDLGFTPTELLLSALGSCISFNLLFYAHRNNIKISQLQVELMSEGSTFPNRINKIKAEIRVPEGITEDELNGILRSVKGSKLNNTLSVPPEIDISISRFS